MSPPNPARGERSRRRQVLRSAASLAIVVAIFVGVIPRIASYGDVWSTLRDMTWLEITSLVVVAIWNVVTYWFLLVAVLPGLTYPQAAVVNQASTAVANTVPGGAAVAVGVSYAMYSSWGFSKSEFVFAAVVSGLWNNFAKLGLPVVALALLAVTGDVTPALLTAAVAGVAVLGGGVVVFGAMLRHEGVARAVGGAAGRGVSTLRRLFHKPPVTGWGRAAARFCARTSAVLHRRHVRITVATLVSHMSLYLVLLTALRHVGISEEEVSWIAVLAAYAFVRLISALPITPGGVGVVELGYTAALGIGLGSAAQAQIVAAVLAFRFITFVLPIPLGAAAYLFWRRNTSWRAQSADTPGVPAPT